MRHRLIASRYFAGLRLVFPLLSFLGLFPFNWACMSRLLVTGDNLSLTACAKISEMGSYFVKRPSEKFESIKTRGSYAAF